MRKRRRTPQEKKILSYQKDRRNNYGQNDKAARKAIPLNKRLAARAQRRSAATTLASTSDGSIEPNTPSHHRGWKKSPDAALADHLDDAYDYGRSGFDQQREDKKGLRAEAKRRLKRRS